MRFRLLLFSLFALSLSFGLISSPSFARSAPRYVLGYDVSFPQCGHSLPKPAHFAIVGVNGGKTDTANPCVRRELTWARKSTGSTLELGPGLYVNTDNPGPKGTGWPKNNRDPVGGYRVADRYGICKGGNTLGCAWQFGWNTAERDAVQSGVNDPLAYTWWLDVETSNVWANGRQLNRADLTGMADYFASIGASAGIYSDAYQWFIIAGPVSSNNPLYALPEWVTGASTQNAAEQSCWSGQFMSGGHIFVSQWYTASATVDGDVSCPSSGFRLIRDEE